jgi:hypothetical protein
MTRPIKTTCEGCGDPDVPVQPAGAIPRFCVACAGYPRNRKHQGMKHAEMTEIRARRRWAREHPDEPYPEDVPDAAPEPVAGPGHAEDPHAEQVVEDQQAAQAYWGSGGLQPPEGPITLNTPVDYDPRHDPVLGDVDDPLAGPVVPGPEVGELVLPDAEDLDLPAHSATVCVAPGCELPRPGHGHDLFCRGHWRLISLDTRQRVLGAPAGPARDRAVLRGLHEIRKALGG